MKRFNYAAGITMAFVIVACSAGHAVAGEQVPFKGTVEGTVHRTLLDPPFAFDRFDITGDATQLGEFDLVIGALVDLSTRTAMGTYEFVAANGDTLSADFLGSSMPTATPGVILITEIGVITGGTGRFAGATGSFVCKRLFEPATGMTVGTFNGNVSSPGAINP